MNPEELKAHYKRLLEAAAESFVSADVPAEQDPEMQQEPNAPELQDNQAPDVQPQVGLTRPINIPRFSPNLHRYMYRPGEIVNFYSEEGLLVQASIVGPPQGDRYDVVDSEGQQYEVIKSELFYPAMQAEMGADMQAAPVEDSA